MRSRNDWWDYLDSQDELMHYGTKGMRWRKGRKALKIVNGRYVYDLGESTTRAIQNPAKKKKAYELLGTPYYFMPEGIYQGKTRFRRINGIGNFLDKHLPGSKARVARREATKKKLKEQEFQYTLKKAVKNTSKNSNTYGKVVKNKMEKAVSGPDSYEKLWQTDWRKALRRPKPRKKYKSK